MAVAAAKSPSRRATSRAGVSGLPSHYEEIGVGEAGVVIDDREPQRRGAAKAIGVVKQFATDVVVDDPIIGVVGRSTDIECSASQRPSRQRREDPAVQDDLVALG